MPLKATSRGLRGRCTDARCTSKPLRLLPGHYVVPLRATAGREAMALGQIRCRDGFSNVGLGLVHGMAHPLGAFYNTPPRRRECHFAATRDALITPEFTGEKFRDIARQWG